MVASITVPDSQFLSLEDFISHPPEYMEWVDGQLLEKTGMTFKQLIAEVASPDDSAEELFAKSKEYLESGCQEVWLLFPQRQLVMINSQQRWLVFTPGDQERRDVRRQKAEGKKGISMPSAKTGTSP